MTCNLSISSITGLHCVCIIVATDVIQHQLRRQERWSQCSMQWRLSELSAAGLPTYALPLAHLAQHVLYGAGIVKD